MTITFDQWVDIIIGDLQYEDGFSIQANAHLANAFMQLYERQGASNPTTISHMIQYLNLDVSDPEWGTYLAILSKDANVPDDPNDKSQRLNIENRLIILQSRQDDGKKFDFATKEWFRLSVGMPETKPASFSASERSKALENKL